MKNLMGFLTLITVITLIGGCSTVYEQEVVPGVLAFSSSEWGILELQGEDYVFIPIDLASYAIDEDTSTYWSPTGNTEQSEYGTKGATEDQNSWLVVAWTDAYDFCKVNLTINIGISSTTTGGGKDYNIEYATSTVTAVWTVVKDGQHGPDVKNVEIAFDPVCTSMLRLHYRTTYGHVPVVTEFVAYEQIEKKKLFGLIPLSIR